MKGLSPRRAVDIACVLALVALSLMVWSVVSPRPIPVILAMSLGQVIGTGSLVALLYAIGRVLRDRLRKR